MFYNQKKAMFCFLVIKKKSTTKIKNTEMKISNSVSIKSEKELAYMREAGSIIADVMEIVTSKVEPGISTKELDNIALKEIYCLGAKPAFLGYLGFPACFCISVNDEIVHGIPSDRMLLQGDIVSIDGGVIVNGYYSDHAITIPVGKISKKLDNLIDNYTGGVGKFFANTFTTGDSFIREGQFPKYRNIPVVRQFIKEKSEYKARSVIYRMLEESGRKKFNDKMVARFERQLDYAEKSKQIDSSQRERMKRDFIQNQEKLND